MENLNGDNENMYENEIEGQNEIENLDENMNENLNDQIGGATELGNYPPPEIIGQVSQSQSEAPAAGRSISRDSEFISLINGLSESIKEYYNVSKHNVRGTNTFLQDLKEKVNILSQILNEMFNRKNFENINDSFELLTHIQLEIPQLQMNSQSNEKNLNLFIEDAKKLFQKMKIKRKQSILEMKKENKKKESIMNLESSNGNNLMSSNQNGEEVTKLQIKIKNLIDKVKIFLSQMSEYDEIIGSKSPQSRKNFINIQKNLLKELEKNVIGNQNLINNNDILLNNQSGSAANVKLNNSQKYERINKLNELKIKNLNEKIASLQKELDEEKTASYKNVNNNYRDDSSIYKKKYEELSKILKNSNNILNKLKSENINLKQKILEQETKEIMNINFDQNGGRDEGNNITQLLQENMKLKEEINQLKNIPKGNMRQSKSDELNLQLMAKNQEIVKLKNLLNNYKNNNNASIKRKNIITNNNDNLNISGNLDNKSTDLIKEKDNKISLLNKRILALTKEKQNLINQIKQSQNKNKYINNPNEINQIQQYMQQIENLKNQLQLKEEEFEIERQDKEKKIMVQQQEIYKLKANNTNNNSALNNNKKIKSYLTQISALKKTLEQKDKKIQELSGKYKRDIDDMNSNILKTNAIMLEKDDLIKRLKMSTNPMIEEEYATQGNNQNQVYGNANKENEINEMKIKIIQLEEELLTKENEIKKYQKLKEENEQLRNDLAMMEDKDKEIEDLENQLRELNEIYSNNMMENNNGINNDNEINIMRMKIAALEKEKKQYKDLAAMLQKQKNNPAKINIKNSNQNNNLTVIQLNQKISQLESENDSLKALIEKLKTENDQLKEKIANSRLPESEVLKKKEEEEEGLKAVIFKLQEEKEKDEKEKSEKNNLSLEKENAALKKQLERLSSTLPKEMNSLKIQLDEARKKLQQYEKNPKNAKNSGVTQTSALSEKNAKISDKGKAAKYENILGKLNDAELEISNLKKTNRELKLQLEDRENKSALSGYKTEDVNLSNYEEEFDLRKMANGAKEKNRSEDINIDYPVIQFVKEKQKELEFHYNLLVEQVKILIYNIKVDQKIKPAVTQICKILGFSPNTSSRIISGKAKKKILGFI